MSRNSTQQYNELNLQELKTTHTGWVYINYNSDYLRERLSKLKEESNLYKLKIVSIENKNLKEKNKLESIIISLKEDNNSLKQNNEIQKININNLNKDKINLLNELKEIKNLNSNLIKDREILVGQIKELNNLINNKISPKLRINENDLIFLQNRINDLENEILSLQNEKIRLNNDNNTKGELIKVLTNQNKKLLIEIKLKYNKDLSFIESIEKLGIPKSINKDIYKQMMNKDNKRGNHLYKSSGKLNKLSKLNISNKLMYFTYDKEFFCNNEKDDIIKNDGKGNVFKITKSNKRTSQKKITKLNNSENLIYNTIFYIIYLIK